MNEVQDHQLGSMDITAQEQTFSSFLRFGRRALVVAFVFLVLLAMWNA